MKGLLLDTNFVSELVRIKPDPLVLAWMARADESALYLSVLTLGEIRKGINDLETAAYVRRAQLETWLGTELPARFAGRVIGVDSAIADRWGSLSSELKRRGTPVATVDVLLAATALQHDLAIVTRNVRDFQKTGVPYFNPWGSAP